MAVSVSSITVPRSRVVRSRVATPTLTWTRRQKVALALVVAVGAAIRALLMPAEQYRPDIDVYAQWAHSIAIVPFDQAYASGINLPPVMVYVWGLLGALDPTFRTAADVTDTAIRVMLKTPAVLADLGLVLAAAWSLRDRPRWAIAASAALALHPALIDDSAWWGQIDALYILPAFIALLLARADRPMAATVALGISLMTKPQALPFLIPFAAFYLGRLDRTQLLQCAAILVGTVALLWAPFLLSHGPSDFMRNVVDLQNGAFALLSIYAWNFWWLAAPVLSLTSPSDAVPILGPLSGRQIGLALAAVGELIVFAAVLRRPTPRNLTLGLATATLVSYCFLTTMHERYSLPALIFLIPLLPDRRILGIWIALSVVITAGMLLPYGPPYGEVSILGAAVMLATTFFCLHLLVLDDGVPPSGETLDAELLARPRSSSSSPRIPTTSPPPAAG